MFAIERTGRILEIIQEEETVSVGALAQELFVSEATIRRDLESLEKRGLIRRVYGGAVLVKSNKDVPLFLRENEQAEAKDIIGRKAASLVRDNDVILLDASSTAFSVVQHLGGFENLVVVTSGLKAAMALGEMHIKTFVTGGLMIDNSYSFIGRHAEALISEINADIMFFSCRGISESGRLTDSSMEEAQLRQLMFRHTKRRVFLAASNKIGREYFYVQGTLEDIDEYVSETPIPEEWQRRIGHGR